MHCCGNWLRIQLFKGLFAIIEKLSAREFSQFRHTAFIEALLTSLEGLAIDPDLLQLTFLDFVRKNYSTIPEFWRELSFYEIPTMAAAIGKRLIDMADSVANETAAFLKSLVQKASQ